MTRLYPAATLGLLLLAALPLSAQPRNEGFKRDLDRLRAENSVLRRELKAIKSIVDGVQAKLEATKQKARTGRLPLKIGVVDLGRVLAAYEQRAPSEERLDQARAEQEALLALKRKELRELGEGPDGESEAGPKKAKRREDLRDAIATHKNALSALNKVSAEALTREILQHIELAVARFASEKGYDLILRTGSSRSAKGPDSALGGAPFASEVNEVLYRSEALDVTQEVIAVLNGLRAEWFEDGPLALVLHALEQAGASYAGKRAGDHLVIDCRLKSTSLAEIARLRTVLRNERIARYGRLLGPDQIVQISDPVPHLAFRIRFDAWKGKGAEAFYSLDRLVELDTSGALRRLVDKLRAAGLEVQGRSGDRLHLTIQGTAELIRAVSTGDLAQAERVTLGLRVATTHEHSPSLTRLELKAQTPQGVRSQTEADLSHVEAGQVYVYGVNASGIKVEMRYVVQHVDDSSVTYVVETTIGGRTTRSNATTWKLPEAGKGGGALDEKARSESYEFAGKSWETRVTEAQGSKTWIPLKGGRPTFPPFLKSEGPTSRIWIKEIKAPQK